MFGLKVNQSLARWDAVDVELTADWRNLLSTSDIQELFIREETTVARDVELCIAEAIVKGILLSRGERVEDDR